MGYPYGPLIRLLILTGQREREVADMVWTEVDFDRALWTIPATRMKGARAHEIPLAPRPWPLLQDAAAVHGGRSCLHHDGGRQGGQRLFQSEGAC